MDKFSKFVDIFFSIFLFTVMSSCLFFLGYLSYMRLGGCNYKKTYEVSKVKVFAYSKVCREAKCSCHKVSCSVEELCLVDVVNYCWKAKVKSVKVGEKFICELRDYGGIGGVCDYRNHLENCRRIE